MEMSIANESLACFISVFANTKFQNWSTRPTHSNDHYFYM